MTIAKTIARRTAWVLLATCAVAASLVTVSCDSKRSAVPKVIVLGFDGMDPRLCERLMDAGQLPNLDGLRKSGGYRPLATTVPPQSPVAWATFITGQNPGVHGIFDFIHRDPARQCFPYYSAAETVGGKEAWEVGDHRLPLTFWPFNHEAPNTVLRRGGTPFWDYLDAAGVPMWIYDIPANYPPSRSKHGHLCCLSGMGVPDLMGGYGTYQYFSEETYRTKNEGGGMRSPLVFEDNRATAQLVGPDNAFLKKPQRAAVPFVVYRHPKEDTARIEFQDQKVVLRQGEWSEWRRIDFEISMPPFLPNVSVGGILRFYLQEVRPNFRLYVTPINIDPADPGEQRISEPPEFVTEISEKLGLFYTAGFQEDHKALSNKIFSDEEYRRQSAQVLEERFRLLDYALDRYEDGLLFFYFSSTDLQAHMFWWDSKGKHPMRTAEKAKQYNGVIIDLYRRMDRVVGDILERYGDDTTVLVMSDHGFCNFGRQFNLNTWLRDNGYVYPPTCRSLMNPARGMLVDWRRTKAFGLGLNGLYINLRGREREGIVDPAERDALLNEITEKLLAVRDPISGKAVVATVYRAEEIYSGPFADTAPDLIVGYHRGYRASWATTLGDLSDDAITDNTSAWSADHCVAADQVPGVIFSNRPMQNPRPTLEDLAPTVLSIFGVDTPEDMKGRSVFESPATASAGGDN